MKKVISVILSLIILTCSLSVAASAASVLGINSYGSTLDLIKEDERLDSNFGTVVENKGIIGSNYATVEKNTGTIEYQYSGLVNNYAGGTITNSYSASTVYNYGGTVEHFIDGTIYNYGGTINNCYAGTVYNFGGTILKNYVENVTEYKKVTLDLSNAEADGFTENDGELWLVQNDGTAVIKPLEGYRFEDAPTVSPDSATLLENEDGSFTVSNVTEDITITAKAVSSAEGDEGQSHLVAFTEILIMFLTLLSYFLMTL